MKRHIPLRLKLTASMLGIWLFIVLAFVIVYNTSISEIDSQFLKEIQNHTRESGIAVAQDVAFEIAASDNAGALAKIKSYEQAQNDVVLLAIMNSTKRVMLRSNQRNDLNYLLKIAGRLDDGTTEITEDFLVSQAPIRSMPEQTDGYVVIIKSLKHYRHSRYMLTLAIILMGIAGLIVATGVAYFIGYRSAANIHKLVANSERIADGDLAHIHIETGGTDEIGRLAASIKRMAEALQLQVLAVKSLTQEIAVVSKTNERSMTELAEAAAEQSVAVNETAAAVEELEKSGEHSAGSANQIVDAAGKTADASNRGQETVSKIYEIIMQIKEDSQDLSEKSVQLLQAVETIGNVILSVKSISEQSKILAVNASIEAAKAGVYGAGFAVVAQEIKDLAQQSKSATLQITGTLSTIRMAIETMVLTARRGRERTAEGVSKIAAAGSAMTDLSEAIQVNSASANTIASNIKQQSIGLTQIASAIDQINSTAIENQRVSRTIADGTRQMNESLSLLTEMMGRWRTPD